MFKLHHWVISLFFIHTNGVCAGTEGPLLPSPACANKTWNLGARALYLQPSFGGNGLGYSAFSFGTDSFNNLVGANNDRNTITTLNPNWAFGFQLEGAYYVACGTDIDVNWYHQRHTTTGYFPNGSLFSGNAPNLYAGFFKTEPSWDAVNLEIGQEVHFNTTKIMRLYGGLEAASLGVTFTNYPRLLPNSNPLFVTTDRISFNGFGPRIGDDFSYCLENGFNIYAKGAAGLLVGTSKQNVSGYQNLVFPQSFSTGNYVQSNQGVVIPELEAKLGLIYDYPTCHGVLGFDLGYMWVNYFSALVSQTGAGLAGSAISNPNATNFNLNGLYFGLKWSSKDG